jgi:molybdenum-dependent DNA-binding transcriptional regulator ModE
MQFTDISTSSLGNIQSWAWNFGDGTTSSLQNPIHTYPGNGTYNVTLTITDLSGCTNTFSNPVVIAAPISLTPTLTQPPCNGGLNGSIALTPNGGFGLAAGYGGYSYSWNGGQSNQQPIFGPAGTYTVTVTDGVCTTTAQYTLNQPTALTATTSFNNANCGLSNGSATIVISGGTPPYSNITWAGIPGATVNGLAPGTYIANFQDFYGCSAALQYSVTIGNGPCGVTSSITKTNVSCFGGNNGTATLTVIGSAPPSNITWSNGGSGSTITNLIAGTYTFNYTDQVPGHAFSGTVVITQPTSAMNIDLTAVDLSCSGTIDGQAIASVLSGGSPPYNYSWSGGQPNNAVASNLSAGIITVTITDGLGCTATATDIITGPPTLTLSTTVINDSCFNANKGSATAVVNGGNPPYTFYWSNISSAQTNLSLGAGTYTVTVTDDEGCTITGSATLNQPSATNYSATSQNINCFGTNTGSINVNISGGTPAYTYTWNPGTLSGNNPTGLGAGTYLLTVTDALNCANLDTFVLTQPASALTVTTSHTDVSCFGLSDGTVTVNISGGTPPYSFQGNPVPPGTTTLPGLAANTYAGNVVDALNCSVAVSETVIQPTALTLAETHVNVLCNGANTGSINVTTNGGTTPYTFAWSNGAATEDLSSLVAGVYSLTVTDNNLCSATISVTITEPTALTLSETHVNVLCNGANTGSINVTTNGGTTPYTFAWSNAATTEDLSSLVAGVYSLTVTDNNLCSATISVTITEPAALTLSETHVNVLCNGANTGSINVTTNGGVTPYTFAWSNGAATEDLSSLVAGVYTLTVTDNNLCSATISVTITEPTALTLAETHVNVLCNGANTGSINVTTNGGTSPYTFAWSNAAATEDLSSLVAGVYSLTVTDNNLCSATISVTITEPAALTLAETHVNVLCNGANTGSINVTTNGGSVPYTFAWSNGAATEDLSTLVAGAYTLTVTDNNLCSATISVTITEPTALTLAETHVNVLCNGTNTGSINVTTNGGTTPYTFAWSNGTATEDLSSLVAGVYSLTVTDNNLCSATISVTITEPAALTLAETHVNVLCNGANTGSINVTTNGGTAPYTFAWSNGAATEDLSSLVAGVYSLTVTDNNLCSATISVTITEPTALTLSETHVNLLCNGANTGSINVTTNGGTTPYTFAWSNAAATEDLSSLVAGVYSLTVTDNNLCSATISVTITEPTALTLAETHVNVLCNGANTGSINVTTSGGTTPYTFAWSNAAATEDLSSLVAGVYTLTVTDNNLCTATISVTITEPTAITSSETHVDALCNGASNGSVDVTVNGGVGPYTYLWSNNATSQDLSNIPAGSYTVTITDVNLCTITQNATVNEPAAPTMLVAVTDATCFGGNGSATATPGGGTAPFNYTWSSNTINNSTNTLAAGSYTVSASDVNGCNQTASFTINQPADIIIQETHTDVTCFGLANGDITLTVSNGVGPNYTYNWSPNVSTSNFAALLTAGTYNVTVTDQANCNKTIAVVISEPALPLTINVQSNNISCFGLSNGSINITTTGGTTPYTYNWSPNVSTTNTATNLSANTYNITVSDVNNCSLITNVTISEPNQPLTVTNTPTNLSCFQSNDGAITLSTTGGSFPYQYVWSPNVSTTNSATGLTTGNYSITITDNNGCTTTNSASLTEPTLLTATENHVNVLCNGAATGSIDVICQRRNSGCGIYL